MHSEAYQELVQSLKEWMTPVVLRAGEFAIERQKNTRDTISRTANVMREDILQALYQTGSVYDDGDDSDLLEIEEEQMQLDEDSNSNSNHSDNGAQSDEENNGSAKETANQGDMLSIDGEKSDAESKDSRVHSEDLLASDDDDDEYEQFAQRGD